MFRWHFTFAVCFQGAKPSGYSDAQMSKAIEKISCTDLSCGDRRQVTHPLPWSDQPIHPAVFKMTNPRTDSRGFAAELSDWIYQLLIEMSFYGGTHLLFVCLAASGNEVSFSLVLNEPDFLALVCTKQAHLQYSLLNIGHASILSNGMPDEL